MTGEEPVGKWVSAIREQSQNLSSAVKGRKRGEGGPKIPEREGVTRGDRTWEGCGVVFREKEEIGGRKGTRHTVVKKRGPVSGEAKKEEVTIRLQLKGKERESRVVATSFPRGAREGRIDCFQKKKSFLER